MRRDRPICSTCMVELVRLDPEAEVLMLDKSQQGHVGAVITPAQAIEAAYLWNAGMEVMPSVYDPPRFRVLGERLEEGHTLEVVALTSLYGVLFCEVHAVTNGGMLGMGETERK